MRCPPFPLTRMIPLKVIAYLLALIAAALCAGCSTTSPRSEAEDPFAIALQECMPALLVSNRVPGAVVSYIKNGEVAWTKAFGVANLQWPTIRRIHAA